MRVDTASLPAWPASRLGEAIEALAKLNGCPPSNVTPIAPATLDKEGLSEWIGSAAERVGLEAEPAILPYPELEDRLRKIAPALLRLPDGRFLALSKEGRLLGPDYKPRKIRLATLRTALCMELEAPARAEVKRLLDETAIPSRRGVSKRILVERLRGSSVGGCWMLRTPPGADFRRTARQSRLFKYLGGLLAVHTAEFALWILSWWVVGLGAMQSRLDRGWLIAWVLLLLTLVPLRVLETWLHGLLSLIGGGLLKERLLYGALQLEPDEIRRQGAGQLLGRVLESEALETLALSGGFLSIMSIVELALAVPILALGAGGFLHAALLALWLACTWLFGWSYYQRARSWTESRLWMTQDLTERMVGHRTRLAQQSPGRRHDGEDLALEHYLQTAADMDRRAAWLMVLAPRGWLIVGILGLCPAFVFGAVSPELLAAGLGGVLLAYRAFRRLGDGIWSLIGAALCWEQVKPVFQAAGRVTPCGNPDFAPGIRSFEKQNLIEAHDLAFRYEGRADPVIRNCSVRVASGDRIVLEGPSGGGKSTFVSLLSGIRHPTSGLLLVAGMDRTALGARGWRRIIAAAPQFHENHVLTGPFAFNLLMGRSGILNDRDFDEAEEICRDLGLGDLIQRMPAGLLQMVGESGWQLSHGERSRLYIARALLQRAEAIVLDESFAALDPENLRRALDCVLKRARTLIVVAHR